MDEKIKDYYQKIEKQRESNEMMLTAVYRSYMVDKFGFWNSDMPCVLPKGLLIQAKFRFNNIDLNTSVTLIDKSIRGVYKFYPYNQFQFSLNPESKNIIWAITDDGKLVYFHKFNEINESMNEKPYTFDMTLVEGKFETYEQLRVLVDKL